MKKLIQTSLAILAVLSTAAFAEEEDKTLKVQAYSFSDSTLPSPVGEPCANKLKYLKGVEEKYKLLGISTMQGPPGVVYTLENNKADVAILKCGTSGGHDDGGHEE